MCLDVYKVLERPVRGLDANRVYTYFYMLSWRVVNLSEIRIKYEIDFRVVINGSLNPTSLHVTTPLQVLYPA